MISARERYHSEAAKSSLALTTLPPSSGFSLVEVLISLLITLLVMAIVFALSTWIQLSYERVSRDVEVSAAVTRALDDMASEIAKAGYGLGELNRRVLPVSLGRSPSGSQISLRSSPTGHFGILEENVSEKEVLYPVKSSAGFRRGDHVLITDGLGRFERAMVTRAEKGALAFQSLDGADGQLKHSYLVRNKARFLKLREVGYRTEIGSDGRRMIVKEVLGRPPQILAPSVEGLCFEYKSGIGERISTAAVERSPWLRLVKVSITYRLGPLPSDRRVLTTAVALGTQSAKFAFRELGYGLRLARYLHPIERPMGAVSGPFKDWGVILAGGWDNRDASYLYTFLAYGYHMAGNRIESVTPLDPIRAPVALALAPEKSAVPGSLFIVTDGLRWGRLFRISPDKYGVFSPESEVAIVYRGEELAQVSALSFGHDNSLYAASRLSQTIYCFRFNGNGELSPPEVVAGHESPVVDLLTGSDGHIYYTPEVSLGNRSPLYKIELDDNSKFREPVLVRHLPGRSIDLAVEPLSGHLFALVRGIKDISVVELDPPWLSKVFVQPEVVFSLAKFRQEVYSGRIRQPKELIHKVSPFVIGEQLPPHLVPDDLDFLSFDACGDLYLGSRDKKLVLKFKLDDRGFDPHEVIVAAVVEEDPATFRSTPEVRLQAWKKSIF